MPIDRSIRPVFGSVLFVVCLAFPARRASAQAEGGDASPSDERAPSGSELEPAEAGPVPEQEEHAGPAVPGEDAAPPAPDSPEPRPAPDTDDEPTVSEPVTAERDFASAEVGPEQPTAEAPGSISLETSPPPEAVSSEVGVSSDESVSSELGVSSEVGVGEVSTELGVTAVVRVPRPTPPPPASASTMDIEVGLLRDVPRRSADQMLTLAPGVLTANHAGEGHAPTLYLRGFDAGEGQDVEILVDGIPINEPSNAHGHGYADARFVMPELVRAVRVQPGAFDARQGNFAVAGSLEYQLGTERRGIIARGEYGSFDTRRLMLAWAPEDAEDGTFVGVELRDGQGFGPNRAHFGAGALARYEHRLDSSVRLHVLGAVQSAQFDSAGVVRADDVQTGRLECDADPEFCVHDPNQGGSASRYLLGAGLRAGGALEELQVSLYGGLRQLRIRENFTGQQLDGRGDGLDQRYEVGTLGLLARYRARIPWDGRHHHVELGATGRYDRGDSAMARVRVGSGVPHTSVFDAGLNIGNIGAWISGDFAPVDALTIQAGLRVDAFQYAVQDRGLPTMDREGERLPERSTDAFGIAVQPRGSVRVRLVDALTWVTSAGVGSRSSDAVALSEGEQAPFARAIGLESGLVLLEEQRNRFRVDANASVFHTYVDRELVFDPSRARNVVAGASNRYGAFAYGRLRFEHWLDVSASVAWTEANLADDARYFDLEAGDRLPYVPRVMGRVDVAARERFRVEGEPFTFGGAAGVTWLGPRPLPNGAEGGAYAVTDASVSFGWRFMEVGVLVQNLFDVRYERASFSYASRFDPARAPSMTSAPHFAAGAPLTAFVTLTLHLTPARWLREAATAAESTPDSEDPT